MCSSYCDFLGDGYEDYYSIQALGVNEDSDEDCNKSQRDSDIGIYNCLRAEKFEDCTTLFVRFFVISVVAWDTMK